MNNKPASIILGVIAIVADLVGILGFIFSGDITKFWSAKWLVYVVGLTLLMGIGFFFFSQANDDEVASFYPLAAGVYAVLSCLSLFALFVELSKRSLEISGFVGMVVLVAFPAFMALAISSICKNSDTVRRTLSYIYAAAGIFAVIFLLVRYAGSPGYSWYMAGEFLGLVLIGIGFLLFADVN